MEIALHIGPHKTGTTSIQKTLRSTFGSAQPTGPVWYPEMAWGGPGHDALARDPAGMNNTVQAAVRAGVETLLISAENLSHSYPDKFGWLRSALAGHDLHLLMTMTPFVVRAPSVWQETVKHGAAAPHEAMDESVLLEPSLQADLLEVAAEHLAPRRISVILAHPGHPSTRLIDNFFDALGLESAPGRPRANRSLGLIEAEMLSRFNALWRTHVPEGDDETQRKLRGRLLSVFLSEFWQKNSPRLPIPIPEDLAVVMAERQRNFLASLEGLKQRRDVRTFGSLELDA